MKLNDSITCIKGIGPRKAEAFGKLGLFTLRDMLYYIPRGHKDFSKITYIMAAKHGEEAVLELTIRTDPRLARIRPGMNIVTCRGYDQSGEIALAWYNQPYRVNSVRASDHVFASGRIDRSRGVKLTSPTLYPKLPGILPIYPICAGVTQHNIREATMAALDMCGGNIPETLPAGILERYSLVSIEQALNGLHCPRSFDAIDASRHRLAFEDVLMYRLMLSMMQRQIPLRKHKIRMEGIKERFLEKLPFTPTKAQLRAMDEISGDITGEQLMNRLLQGDVGSGKTAVAMFAMFAAVENGMQAVLMAPTEILAAQHYTSLCKMFGKENAAYLRGGMKKAERSEELARIASGSAKVITGTHALFQQSVEFYNLGMVITDEQHRFGVRQRAAIGAKGSDADVLIMSATPIPRTLALILYGDLDVSILDELPPGRKPIMTRIVPEHKREDMYGFIGENIKNGRQAYVVCPLVESSENLEDVQSAKELFEELRLKFGNSVGLLHGQMGAAAKEKTAEAFRKGEIAVLVATTVIEVGVDVPNATVMVIENADRFGLAQLHQLRGRVGRGSQSSYCFLLSGSEADTAVERLNTLVRTNDGFEIAQKDLDMRGPGEFLGMKQHGIDEFAAASLAGNMATLEQAREAADMILSGETADEGLMDKARERLAVMALEVARN